jgi:hypothetical protein
MSKKCFKCELVKDISEFYAHPAMADGHVNKCKECSKKAIRESRDKRSDYYKQFDRDRSNLPHRKEARLEYYNSVKGTSEHRKSRSEANSKYIKNNRERYLAHNKAKYYLRKGTLKKMPCEVCGGEKVEAHHEDYSFPLNITWLCPKHHYARHVEKRREERT